MMRSKRLLFLLGFAFFVTGFSAQAEVVTVECKIDYSRDDARKSKHRRRKATIKKSCLVNEGFGEVDLNLPVLDGDDDVIGKLTMRVDFESRRRKIESFEADHMIAGNFYPMDGRRERFRTYSARRHWPKYSISKVFESEPTGDNYSFDMQLTPHCKVEFLDQHSCPGGFNALRRTEPIHWNDQPAPQRQQQYQRQERIIWNTPRTAH